MPSIPDSSRPPPAQGRLSSSLTRRLTTVLAASLTAVGIALGLGGYWLIVSVAEQSADRVLGASARSIAETLVVENGDVTLDLPASALGMLENNERDNVYYSIRRGTELLTGYADLPQGRVPLEADTTYFRYETYRGEIVRIAQEARRLPRIREPVIVQVAETVAARRAVVHRLLAGLILLEFLLVGIAAILVWPAVRWSLRPVMRLRGDIESREGKTTDFTHLDDKGVPSELRGLVQSFNSLLTRLESSVERMRSFTADASHQMRTPLAVLRTHLAVLRQNGTETAEGRQSLDDVETATGQLQRLLTQLVALARADAEADRAKATELADVQFSVEAAISRLRKAAVEAQVDVQSTEREGEFLIQGEQDLLDEVIFNLVDNAIRYNQAGGRVRIRVGRTESAITVAIEDDGPGIPAAERDKVFQRFHRLSRDQHREGSGLGLPIVRTLAGRLNGRIALTDGLDGKGVGAHLSFPLTQVLERRQP